MHTLYRFLRAMLSYARIVALFAAWGVLALLAGAPEAGMFAVVFAAIFFAPAAFSNTWDDIGD